MRSLILASTLLCQVLHSQVIQPQPQLLPGTGGTWNVQWLGIQGRSYFLQASDDLVSWHYAPLIEAGNDEIIEYETGALGSRHFLRLAYVNQTASNLDTADFDDDDLGNLAEINVHHTDPLKQDTDEDGMPDGWEINHGLDPNDNGSISFVNGPSGDKDGDGIPNFQEFQGGTDPVSPGSFPVSLIFVERTANQNFSTPSGTLHKWASWLPEESSTDTISSFSSPQGMSGQLESAFTFPALPPTKATISPIGGTVGAVSANYGSTESGGGRSVQGHVQHGRFWLKATPLDIAKGRGSQKFLKMVDRYTGPYSGGSTRVERLITVEKLEAQASTGYSEPFDIKPEVITGPGNFFSSTITILTPVSIKPVEGMAGVVGDMVPSNQTTDPELHFVTPKKTAEIAEDYVTFTATGITEQQITNGDAEQIVEWDGGQPVLNEPLKRKVSRAVADKTPIRIKTLGKFGGQEVAKVNVWVIWCDCAIEDYENVAFLVNRTPDIFEPAGSTYGGIMLRPQEHWRFRFKISPAEMTSGESDRPDLEGPNTTPVPGGLKQHMMEPQFPADHAALKWDVSRRVEITILNPNLIPKEKFPGSYVFKNQPKVSDPVVSFPQNPVEGNDDPSGQNWRDEDDNPYRELVENGLSHSVGEISSYDGPIFGFKATMGVGGATLAQVANFQEFARVELESENKGGGDRTWYRISDYVEWHHVMAATFGEEPGGGSIWANSGSTFGRGRFEVPE